MADDRSKVGRQDDARINVEQAYPRDELRSAVAKAGHPGENIRDLPAMARLISTHALLAPPQSEIAPEVELDTKPWKFRFLLAWQYVCADEELRNHVIAPCYAPYVTRLNGRCAMRQKEHVQKPVSAAKSPRMMTIDFQRACATFLALKELFATRPKGKLDRAAFDRVQALCREAARAVSDIEWRRALRNIEVYSALLSSSQSEAPCAADFVHLRVQHALASLGSKLKVLEASDATVV
jgi:hypothetical protein